MHKIKRKQQKAAVMADQKLDNLLNLALDSTEEERKKSGNLNIGYEERSGNWDIIVKYLSLIHIWNI